MKNYTPIYENTFKFAMENGEKDICLASYRENAACANAISDAIRRNFDGYHLRDCAGPVIEEYGLERVRYILANTIQLSSWDGRWSKANLAWAEDFYIPESECRNDWRVSAHTAVLNGFVDDVRKIEG